MAEWKEGRPDSLHKRLDQVTVTLTREEAKLLLGGRDPDPATASDRERARGKLRSALDQPELGEDCERCSGRGWGHHEDPCAACHGTGKHPDPPETLSPNPRDMLTDEELEAHIADLQSVIDARRRAA